MSIKFGPGGNSDSFALEGFKKTADAPKWIAKKGLSAFEYQCGRGINISDATAKLIGDNARQNGIEMSLHTPYFINLSKIDEERATKNINYILNSARVIDMMSGNRLIVHLGGLSKLRREVAYENTKINLKNMLNALEESDYSHIKICIETMGKINVLGDLHEISELCAMDERLIPCIDFGHLNAREHGKYKEKEDFDEIFKTLENDIGYERTSLFHGHFSKIEYSNGGEVRHLTFEDTIYGPEFLPLAKSLKDRNYKATIICESAGTQAEDAVTMKEIYEEVLRNG